MLGVMRVLVLANERSGAGKARHLARVLVARLEEGGHAVLLVDPAAESASGTAGGDGSARVHGVPPDAVVAVGGDGTIFHTLPALVRDGTPVYHVPGGNENLFAREFGMTSDPALVLSALRAARELVVDVGLVDGAPFALMVSIGPDAGVIHRLHAARRRASGHAMYLRPSLAEALRPHLPRLTIRVGDREVVSGRRGLAVVANCRRYALRLDPARRADMRDGELDVVFLPAGSTARALLWLARCLVGEPGDWEGAVVARGSEVRVEAADRAPWQVDGEAGGWLEPGVPLVLGVSGGSLRVLCP